MIVKIDHIAFGTKNFLQIDEDLKKLGYVNSFTELDVPNMECTRSVMLTPSGFFNIGLYEKPGNIGIELLTYGTEERSATGMITPVLNFSDDIIATDGSVHNTDFKSVSFLNSPALMCKDQQSAPVFNGIRIKVSNLKKFSDLLRSFRFRLLILEENTAIFKIQRHSEIFFIYVESIPQLSKDYIDTLGFTVLALITTDVMKERKTVEDCGYNPTAISQLILGKKVLEIFFFHVDDGAIIEVIGVKR